MLSIIHTHFRVPFFSKAVWCKRQFVARWKGLYTFPVQLCGVEAIEAGPIGMLMHYNDYQTFSVLSSSHRRLYLHTHSRS